MTCSTGFSQVKSSAKRKLNLDSPGGKRVRYSLAVLCLFSFLRRRGKVLETERESESGFDQSV